MNSGLEPFLETAQSEASFWCLRLAEGSLSPDERHRLDRWLEDAENRLQFDRMTAVWDLSRQTQDMEEMLDLRAQARAALQTVKKKWWTFGGPAVRYGALASCLVLALLIGFLVMDSGVEVYRTAEGERRILDLADGSHVMLDASSRLEVELDDRRRSLRLVRGRARFDVAKDPRRPFIVLADGKQVVATGTSFSVELVRAQVRVVLFEGAVAVLKEGPDGAPPQHIALAGGQGAADRRLEPGKLLIASLAGETASIRSEDLDRAAAWQNGQLIFSDEPLVDAVERVNRYSRVKVGLRGEAVKRLLISGTFNAGDTEGFADGVSALFHIRIARSGGDIIISD